MELNNLISNQQNIIDIAITFWAIKKYSNKLISDNNLENKSRPLISNISKFEQILTSLNIEIIDYTNQKYNEGMNVDIIDTVKSDVQEAIIKETIEPTIIYNNNIIKRARVIKEINRSCDE